MKFQNTRCRERNVAGARLYCRVNTNLLAIATVVKHFLFAIKPVDLLLLKETPISESSPLARGPSALGDWSFVRVPIACLWPIMQVACDEHIMGSTRHHTQNTTAKVEDSQVRNSRHYRHTPSTTHPPKNGKYHQL
eukprot:1336971-Pyramimonas_sp.AAC.3